jgi:hypothetical protein
MAVVAVTLALLAQVAMAAQAVEHKVLAQQRDQAVVQHKVTQVAQLVMVLLVVQLLELPQAAAAVLEKQETLMQLDLVEMDFQHGHLGVLQLQLDNT